MSASGRLVLTSLLEAPRLSLAILGAGAAHVGLVAAGFGGWPCPFYHVTGWPCPGCGLGRACVLVVQGDWRGALWLHAYAPVLVLVLAILAVGLILKGRARAELLGAIRWLEERAFLGVILLAGLIVYWVVRLVLDEAHWRMLVS